MCIDCCKGFPFLLTEMGTLTMDAIDNENLRPSVGVEWSPLEVEARHTGNRRLTPLPTLRRVPAPEDPRRSGRLPLTGGRPLR